MQRSRKSLFALLSLLYLIFIGKADLYSQTRDNETISCHSLNATDNNCCGEENDIDDTCDKQCCQISFSQQTISPFNSKSSVEISGVLLKKLVDFSSTHRPTIPFINFPTKSSSAFIALYTKQNFFPHVFLSDYLSYISIWRC